jgi:hypothetical protein
VELARDKFLLAEKAGPPTSDLAYSRACAEALLGRSDDALRLLERAFVLGFNGCSALQANTELDSLRSGPQFAKIVATYCQERR